jgi:hypothetical protein
VADAASRFPKGLPVEASSCDLFVVGWSVLLKRMSAVQFTLNLNDGNCVSEEIEKCRIGPGIPQVPPLDDDRNMLHVAWHQVRWMEESQPHAATGGRLLIAEVSRKEISLWEAGPITGTHAPRVA